MMAVMDDRDLLEDYRTRQSELAFAQLVERHLALVYSTALRITRQPALAEDVAQAVFITLARRAAQVRDAAALPGWLYRTTCHHAYNGLRAEKRRRDYETAAMQTTDLLQNAPAAWARLAPLLDEAMSQLNPADQDLVVSRFVEGRSLREIGAARGLSDDATQKRVHRAVEQLRELFAKNGVAIPAAVLTPAIVEHAVHPAPALLAPKISVAAQSVATAGGGVAFFKLLLLMSQTKIKSAALALVGVLFFSAIGWSIWANVAASRNASKSSSAYMSAIGAPGGMPGSMAGGSNSPNAAHAARSSSPGGPQESPSMVYAVAGKIADKAAVTDHLNYGRNLAIAFLTYASKHDGETPPDIQTVSDTLDASANNYSYQMTYHGLITNITKPAETVILQEAPFPVSNSEWARSYVYADGHVELGTSSNSDFSSP
mgnify:CR=1 FL=1